MKGCFTFQWRWCFSDGGASFLSVEGEGAPHRGASVFVGMFSKKIVRWAWGRTSPPPCHSPPSHYGKPCVLILNFFFACSLLLCMFSACSVLQTLLMFENVSYVSNVIRE